MKKYYILIVAAFCILLAACNSGDARTAETDADTAETTVAETVLTATEDTQITEESTVIEETTAEETTEAPDGVFESNARLSGFNESKNGAYLTAKGSSVKFNADGSVTLTGTWKPDERFQPVFTVAYRSLMSSCLAGYTDTDSLLNAGEQKYRAAVIAARLDKSIAGDTSLCFTCGKRQNSAGTQLTLAEAEGSGEIEYLVYDMGENFTADYLNKLEWTWACGYADAENLGASVTIYSIEFFDTLESAVKAVNAQPKAENLGNRSVNFAEEDLTWELHNIFDGNYVRNETVMFIDRGDVKQLLYKIDEVISVTSYDGKIIYTEGVDYAVEDGKLKVLEDSRIPCITSAVYYNGDGTLQTERNGKMTPTHWGEGTAMTAWQVNVEYTHSDAWEGYKQPCYAEVYDRFFKKLENGEDVTVIFYGDSCTYGAASSFAYGYAPYQYSYALLVTEALADIYGYTVKYVKTGLGNVGPVPSGDYVAGTNGTITYINTSVGGWTSADGVRYFDKHLAPFIDKYGCDLFVIDLGGNDGSIVPRKTRENDEKTINAVLDASPETSVVVMSTLLNRPGSNWAGKEYMQEPNLLKMTEMYRRMGVPCALCGITSMTDSMLDYIKFEDFTGNNVNHPNDFWARAYACTLFETLVGYENLQK